MNIRSALPAFALSTLALGGCANVPEAKEVEEIKVTQKQKLELLIKLCDDHHKEYLFQKEKCVYDKSRDEGMTVTYPFYLYTKEFKELVVVNKVVQKKFVDSYLAESSAKCSDENCKKLVMKSYLMKLEVELSNPERYSVEELHILLNGYLVLLDMYIYS